MLYDKSPITNAFISIPPDLGQLDCAALIAGMVAGVLTGANFQAKVSAYPVEDEEVKSSSTGRMTVYLIKFSPEVI